MEETFKKRTDMEEKNASNVHINIYGGTNQILPNAVKAEQHFHYAQGKMEEPSTDEPSRPWLADDEHRLSLYIEKEGRLQAYIAVLSACTTAQQVGEAVAQMCVDEPKITAELIAKEKFIRLLLPFLIGVGKGKSIDNLRLNINEAWAAYKKNRREKGL